MTSSPSFVRAPEGNGYCEWFIRILKENLLWVRSFATVEELRWALLFTDVVERPHDAPLEQGKVTLGEIRVNYSPHVLFAVVHGLMTFEIFVQAPV